MLTSTRSPRSAFYRFEVRPRDIEPPIWNFRLSRAQLKTCEQIIEEHYDELIAAWHKHFNG
jgi:hypothetical protein